eukprot:12712567-Alexandrium_andersonii.AAC.1
MVKERLCCRWAGWDRRPELATLLPHHLVDALPGGVDTSLRADARHRCRGRVQPLPENPLRRQRLPGRVRASDPLPKAGSLL